MKEKFRTLNIATKGFAIPIIILCILAGGIIFYVAPFFGIFGGINLITGNIAQALIFLELAIVPTAFNFVLGGLMLANAAIDIFSPVPDQITEENCTHPCWKRRTIVWWISIIGLTLLILAGWASAVVAFQNIETEVQISGFIFVFLHLTGMLIFTLGGLGELIYGKPLEN